MIRLVCDTCAHQTFLMDGAPVTSVITRFVHDHMHLSPTCQVRFHLGTGHPRNLLCDLPDGHADAHHDPCGVRWT